MGFAGALPDALHRYTVGFGATEYQLTWNFRSSDGLVLLQHVIASRLDPDVVQAVSKAGPETGHVPASLWTFGSAAREADYIAGWIARDIAGSGRTPADFALVARQRVADYEHGLAAALAGHGISLRNDDVAYGGMKLQEMLKHQAARLVLGVLRLAAEPGGLAGVWLEVTATLARIDGSIDDDVAARRLGDNLSRFTRDLRAWLAAVPVGLADPAEAVGRAVGAAGLGRLAGYVRSAHPGDDITLILGSLTERLRHVMPGARDWAQALVAVEAADAVTLMTVHRSKGLEYHTVFFLGLDDDQWWAYQRNADEATSAFFVGLSRAAQPAHLHQHEPGRPVGEDRGPLPDARRGGRPRNPRSLTGRDSPLLVAARGLSRADRLRGSYRRRPAAVWSPCLSPERLLRSRPSGESVPSTRQTGTGVRLRTRRARSAGRLTHAL